MAPSHVAGRHELLLGGGKQDVFVDLKLPGAARLQVDAEGAGKALELVGLDDDTADLPFLGILGGDLVIEVVLAGDAYGHSLQLHVQILGDEDAGGTFFLHLLNGEAGGHDAMIDGLAIGEDLGEPAHGGGGLLPAHGLVHEDADGAATGGLHATRHFFRLVVEDLGEEAVDGACVRSALGLLVLEPVEFGEDLDGNEEMVVVEAVEAVRVVQEDVGIEHEVLHLSGGRSLTRPRRGGKEKVLFLGYLQRGGSVHGAGQVLRLG